MIHQLERKRFQPWLHSLRAGAVLLALLLGVAVQPALAQDFRVEGTVVGAVDNFPLPGVNIVEVGTTNGTVTDPDGGFALTVAGPNAQLAVSYVGFLGQTIDVDGRNEITIALEEDVAALEEVVVTAFGIEREQKALGYAVGTVSGERLAEVREPNIANALAGKVAGVVVSKPATGPSGSSRVVIRGNSSLGGDNQPLYVVDGVPIDNRNLGSAGMWGGIDRGDGISSINPNDIASVTVLKGAAAAALYGSRASNGVILITTKTGRGMLASGIGVEYNANVTFEDALVGFSDYQTGYGQGFRGVAPTSVEEAVEYGTSSWGAPLDPSQMVIQFDGVARPYALVEDKLDRFYQGGLNTTNTLALTGGFDQTTVRFSASHLNNESIVPNSGMQRLSFNLRGTSRFGRLTADVKANYVREDVNNRARLSDSPGNPNFTIAVLPTNVDPQSLKPGNVEGNELQELGFTQNIFATNSYWAANNYVNDDQRDRFIGFAQLGYDLTDWLTMQGRVGQDWYTSRSTNVTPYGTRYSPTGDMSEGEIRVLERNVDFLVLADKQLASNFGVNATFGGNRMYRRFESLTLSGSGFSIPGLITMSNLATQSNGYGLSEKAINALFGSATFSYSDYLFLTATGRNDWSSTLPLDNNSYFYPSISGSFVFSDAFEVPSWLSFGKLRASWAEVGGDTDPYSLLLTYGLLSFTHMGQPLGVIPSSVIPLAGLKPSSTVGKEVGFDLRFFDNRLGLDLTLYTETARDQILSTTVPATSGYSAKVINAGALRNSGIEMLLTTTPVRTPRFSWNLDLNFADNNNEVLELYPGLESLTLGEARSRVAFVTAEVGQPYGTIKGYAYARDPQGNIILEDGLPVQSDELTVLGVGLPDWTSGIMNTFRFRNFTLYSLLHVSMGGELYSGTNATAYSTGLHKNTIMGREACEDAGYDANGGTGCWVPDGVVEVTDADGNVIGYEKNTVATFPDAYYSAVSGRIAEEFVYDASYVKLREMQFSYRLPNRWLADTPLQMATVSLVGRNLLLLYSKVPNIDPESNYNNTNAQGLEWSGVPQTRTFGFNVNLKF